MRRDIGRRINYELIINYDLFLRNINYEWVRVGKQAVNYIKTFGVFGRNTSK